MLAPCALSGNAASPVFVHVHGTCKTDKKAGGAVAMSHRWIRSGSAAGRDGLDGRNGFNGPHGSGGRITVTYDPQAKPYIGLLHLSNRYGPRPVFSEQPVPSLW